MMDTLVRIRSGNKANRVLSTEDMRMWNMIMSRDPRLEWLIIDARAQVDGGGEKYCRVAVFNAHFLPRISALVGTKSVNAKSHLLGSDLTQDYVCDLVMRLLPPCRGCEHTEK